ncbi:hypothetical protein D3C77_704660 [compost metagenome]
MVRRNRGRSLILASVTRTGAAVGICALNIMLISTVVFRLMSAIMMIIKFTKLLVGRTWMIITGWRS